MNNEASVNQSYLNTGAYTKNYTLKLQIIILLFITNLIIERFNNKNQLLKFFTVIISVIFSVRDVREADTFFGQRTYFKKGVRFFCNLFFIDK